MKKKNNFIIAGNWKMNPTTLADAKKLYAGYKKLAKKYTETQFISCVPPVYLHSLGRARKSENLTLGAENVYFQDHGSYTGAVSVSMVQDAGAGVTLVGHSERRGLFGVSDEIVNKKIQHCIEHKMPVLVCFGESDRDEAGEYTEEIERQLSHITSAFTKTRSRSLLTLAYEPVWAIGAGAKRSVTEDELFSTMLLIRNILDKQLGAGASKKIAVLYGGSVNPTNAESLSRVPGLDGFLIGRASLGYESLRDITAAVTKNN